MKWNVTRWNSLYFFLFRLLVYEKAIDHALSTIMKEKNPKQLNVGLSNEEWIVINGLVHVLHPINEITVMLQGKEMNISYTIACVKRIVDHLVGF